MPLAHEHPPGSSSLSGCDAPLDLSPLLSPSCLFPNPAPPSFPLIIPLSQCLGIPLPAELQSQSIQQICLWGPVCPGRLISSTSAPVLLSLLPALHILLGGWGEWERHPAWAEHPRQCWARRTEGPKAGSRQLQAAHPSGTPRVKLSCIQGHALARNYTFIGMRCCRHLNWDWELYFRAHPNYSRRDKARCRAAPALH